MKNLFFKAITLAAFTFTFLGCSSDDSKQNELNSSNCPTGFTGFNCEQQITPAKISITKVTVVDFPYLDSDGFGWDSFTSNENEADIYISIENSNGQPLDVGNTYYENADKFHEYPFILPSPIVLSNPNEILSIDLFDYDGADTSVSEDDFIGKIYFSLYSNSGGFPEEKTIINGKFKYRFSLQYQW